MAATHAEKMNHSLTHSPIKNFIEKVNEVVVGKEHEVLLAAACVLARGHLLVEDRPGMGKSTLVKAMSKLLNLETQRVQFTNDLLPADILGVSIFHQNTSELKFQKGPIFTQLFFADELNRATPKTQSACLQAMEEQQISIDGQTYDLPKPFFVIATQNPLQNIGTYPLPESQLDRFLMRVELGYPDREAEKRLLTQPPRHELLDQLTPVMTPGDLEKCQNQVDQIHVSETLIEYVQDLIEESRRSHAVGVSPRGALGLVAGAKAWAFLQERDFVVPEDIQAVAAPIMGHRLGMGEEEDLSLGNERVKELIERVPVRE